ncbi:TIGR04282 family arsenosugar biosynthesis glycosyltransferase [Kiritimatiellaeota bacterium B1221]|nr:TIGR04282 family arsenosugar biosynthesis glycosyltransferase [Kiritimatiellaeota bacterium B1221]
MHILLFLKAPRPGTVKTRLAKTMGNEKALTIYKQLVSRQLKNLPQYAQVEVHFAPSDAEKEMRTWLGEHIFYVPQCSGDLGDRLSYGVQHAFTRGAEQVICIGGDCPELGCLHFQQSLHALENDTDVVLGPTFDGGYYLLAMKQFHRELFKNIPWSTAETLKVTLQRARAARLTTHLLETCRDVDQEADWLQSGMA